MPRAAPPPGSLRVAYEGHFGAATWAVIQWLMFTGTGDPSVADLDTLAGDLHTLFGNLIHHGEFAGGLTLSLTKIRYAPIGGTGAYETTQVADVTGTGSGDTESAQVCYMINWQTTDPRRGGKPRSYIPGVQTSNVYDSGRVGGAAVTSLNGYIATYLAGIQAISVGIFTTPQLVEMSFVDRKAFRTTPLAYTIYRGTCNPVVGTQRRRVDRMRNP